MIILITDSIPTANGGGISQTLYNLFDGWQGSICFISRPGENKIKGPVLDAQFVAYSFKHFGGFSNRLLKKLNGRVSNANFNRQQLLKKLPAGLPSATEAFVLVSTTEPIKLHFAWLLQERFGYTVIPYFMDDWMAGLELKWKGGSIQEVVACLLRKAPCWLMISRQLEQTLVKRYGLKKKPFLIVHNPSPPSPQSDDQRQPQDKMPRPGIAAAGTQVQPLGEDLGAARIIYAGSIWPMHLDALVAVSKAVQLLCQEKVFVLRQVKDDSGETFVLRQAQHDIVRQACLPARQDQDDIVRQAHHDKYRLLIYTSEATWKHNRKALEGPGIEYGGYIPYEQMQEKYKSAGLLLVAASFLPQYAPFTNSSVQTKLTDYMAAGKPILYVGPETGASGQFVHEWDCGYTIGTNRPGDIAAQLTAISGMQAVSERKARNGLQAANGYFSKPVVQKRLYAFLREHARIASSFRSPGVELHSSQ